MKTESQENNEEIQEKTLYAESIFGHNTRRGLVRLSCEDSLDIVITPAEARAFAVSVLEAAQAAETDEILMNWLQNGLGLKDDQKAAAVLVDFRNIRTEMRRREILEAKITEMENL